MLAADVVFDSHDYLVRITDGPALLRPVQEELGPEPQLKYFDAGLTPEECQ